MQVMLWLDFRKRPREVWAYLSSFFKNALSSLLFCVMVATEMLFTVEAELGKPLIISLTVGDVLVLRGATPAGSVLLILTITTDSKIGLSLV